MKTRQTVGIATELVLRAQAGDKAAFNELYRLSGATVYQTVYSMVQDEDSAWRIYQRTYILAWRDRNTLKKPESFLHWLQKLAIDEATKTLEEWPVLLRVNSDRQRFAWVKSLLLRTRQTQNTALF